MHVIETLTQRCMSDFFLHNNVTIVFGRETNKKTVDVPKIGVKSTNQWAFTENETPTRLFSEFIESKH